MGGQISGGASVTYSNIEGGYEGEGNIDEDPWLDPNYHLLPCSPCIDTGDPNGDYDGQVDIDGDNRVIDIDGKGDGVVDVDMGADEFADCDLLLYAHCPRPADDATDVPLDVVLSWCPGKYAADVDGHKVYFDDVEDNVSNRSGCDVNGVSTTDPCYPLPPLELGRTYYWAVDEVNDSNTWEGTVWHFTASNCLVLEDFESYECSSSQQCDDALWNVWSDYSLPPYTTSAQILLKTDPVHGGGKSMELWYRNDLDPYYSETDADIADLPSGIGSDWTGSGIGGIKELSLWFHGKSGNPVSEQMYVALEDGAGRTGVVKYGDMNDVNDPNWQEWNIDLQGFVDDNDVNLADVNKLYIGFGDRYNPTKAGYGFVYFDDIRLYIICIFSERSEEFARCDYAPPGAPAGDCRIDYRELDIMARDWLMAPPPDPNVDLYGDDTIDFRDFAILAEMWLEEQMTP